MAQVASAQATNSLSNANYLRQKRARSQLSCVPCRSGKLKCNRSHDPACDQCIKRDRGGQCIYMPAPVKQKPAQNVKGRIRHLETLLVELMNSQSQNKDASEPRRNDPDVVERNAEQEQGDNAPPFSEPTPPSDNDTFPRSLTSNVSSSRSPDEAESTLKPFGKLRVSKKGTSYVGDSHWQTILNGISELKRDLDDDEDSADDGFSEDEAQIPSATNAWGAPIHGGHPATFSASSIHTFNSNSFMLGAAAPMSRDALIAAVPEKKVADRLLSLWFNSPDPFKPIIHGPTFQEEYRAFRSDPKSTPNMWLGLLFSILSLASSFGLRDLDPASPAAEKIQADVQKYHNLAASAACNFTKTKRYTVECLILYSAGLRSNDAFVNVWLMIGLVIRLALRMGYHRDPANYPAISAFDGEMRRRAWAIITMIDVLISFQLGLPSMVKTIQSDTAAPRNILDRDFSKTSVELPPSRGIDELTPCSYVRAKLLLTRIFAEATDLSHVSVNPCDEQIAALDARLEEAKAQIPPLLQMPDISEVVTDPAEQLMCRFNLDLLYSKTKIIIHRRSMQRPFAALSPHEQQMGIGRSRKFCVDAALRVLHHHHTIYIASQPGGQLESVKWYMGSISTHDFLLAAMIICLELSQQIGDDHALNPCGTVCPQRSAMMDALEKSQKIWSDSSRRQVPHQLLGVGDKTKAEHMFGETEKASRALAVMLKKVKVSFPEQARALAETRDGEPWETYQATRKDFESPTSDKIFKPHAHLHRSGVQNGYNGIMTQNEWNDMEGVPEYSPSMGHQPYGQASSHASSTGIMSGGPMQLQSYETTPDSAMLPNDFATLDDLLDTQGILDWEMLDGAIRADRAPSAWTQDYLQADTQLLDFEIAAASANAGAFRGPPSMGLDAVTMGEGSAAGSMYPDSWMSFADMTDVDLGLANTMRPGV